eukprot:c17168_g1_i1 orf=1012-3003(+)
MAFMPPISATHGVGPLGLRNQADGESITREMVIESALTLEEVITLASEEVSKAIILEEKAIVRDSQVSICLEDITIASEEKVKAGSIDVEKTSVATLDEKIQSAFVFEESVCVLGHNADENASLEEMVKRLQVEVLALRKKRADEGRANEKVVSIYASREQAWKAERRRFMNEQRRLWQELQRAFMEQEVLKQRTQCLSSIHENGDFEFACEECEQREGWLAEMKERLHEQEFVIMTSMEEAKAEKQEKNTITVKFAALEADYCQVNEKLRLEADARTHDLQRHEAALTELAESCRTLEGERSQALHDVECLRKSLADVRLEKKHYEDLVSEMSTEIHMLLMGAHEKDDIISAMLKKSDADAEERHELERELNIIKAKFLHVESEKEKWHKDMDSNNPSCIGREMMKPRRSLGSKADGKVESGFDKMRELQRLHDVEIQDLQAAFEEEVTLLKKRLSLFQERVADLEENVLLRMAKNIQYTNSFKGKKLRSHAEHVDGLSVLGNHMEPDTTTQQFQLSVAKTLLRQYVDTDTHREQQIEEWKKAYFASKASIEMLHKERGYAVSSPRTRGLGDWLELERIRSKLEQRHLQEIIAFERQLKARDERMEAFRQQLLAMESEAEQRVAEIETLKKDLKSALQVKSRLQELMMEDFGREQLRIGWET